MTDEDKAYLDLAWKLYNEHATQARQHETLRSSIATSLITLATAFGAFYQYTSGNGAGFSGRETFVGTGLIIIGLTGIALTYKHYERNRRHATIKASYLAQIDDVLSSGGRPTFDGILQAARERHHRDFPISKRVRLHWLWSGIFALVVLAGIHVFPPLNWPVTITFGKPGPG